jgi:hypothetical protein
VITKELRRYCGLKWSSQQQLVEPLCGSVPVQGHPWSGVEEFGDVVEVGLGVFAQVGAFGQELAERACG